MKNFIFLLIVCVVAACTKKQPIIVTNESSDDLSSVPVVVSQEQVLLKLGTLSNDELPLAMEGDKILEQQLDDLDGDGQWDDLAFLVDINAASSKEITLSTVSLEDYPQFEQTTNVHLGVDYSRKDEFENKTEEVRRADNIAMVYPPMYQMEGPAWENDKVGFRNYFDSRNGKDIYGKITGEIVLPKAGMKGQNYHILDDWGMDILKVGNSLGAGALAIQYEDTLIRLSNTSSSEYKLITSGPVRSIFELAHKGWATPFGVLDITERISIYTGEYCYREEIIANNSELNWVAGIVNVYADTVIVDNKANYAHLATYGKQSENKDYLGMAVVSKNSATLSFGVTPDEGRSITETHFVILGKNNPSYLFVAGWELSDERFNTAEGFIDYINGLKNRLELHVK